MKRSSRARCLAMALAAGLLLGAWSAGGRDQTEKGIPTRDNGERFERYVAAYVQFRRTEPADDVKPASEHIRQADGLREWLKKLEAIPRAGLTLDQDVDYRLIRSSILTDIARIERERTWEKDPGMYIPYSGIESLVAAGGPDPAEKERQLLRAFEGIPQGMAIAKANLRHPPRLLLDQAVGTMRKALAFYEKEVRECLEGMAPKTGKLRLAYEKALASLKKYQEFLEQHLGLQADGTLGIGRDLYDYYLAETYLMKDDVDSMLKKGERYFADTLRQLEDTAARIDPRKSWQELIRENRGRHPDANGLLPAWEREILRARQHVIDKDLATIPPGEKVLVLPMPASQRERSPFGIMDTPQPFADSRTGRLFINPVDAGLAEATKEKLLSGHDFTFIATIAPHETYPGHHLHALRIQENPRPLRRLYNSTLFTEGWGLYVEELMYETGFFKDAERTRLTQLLSRLWRAARVILDVKLQTGRISYEEARRFLEERILFEPERSAGEVNMYVSAPTYFITYINGYYDIMNLREETRRKKGGDFSLKGFHEALLGTGALPTPLLREVLRARH